MESIRDEALRDPWQKAPLIRLVVACCALGGLLDGQGFRTDVRISQQGLSEFVAFCRRNRIIVEETMGRPLRGDFESKAVRQLNVFLALLSLRLIKAKRSKAAGALTFYRLDPARLAQVSDFAENFDSERAGGRSKLR